MNSLLSTLNTAAMFCHAESLMVQVLQTDSAQLPAAAVRQKVILSMQVQHTGIFPSMKTRLYRTQDRRFQRFGCRWLKVLKDRPVQPPSGFVVALHYQSLQIISNSFRDLPLNLLDIIKGFFQKRLIFYYTSVLHRVFFVLLGGMQ